ncbi:MAG: ADP-dependent glucokinase/phosphofructokinase, partial [Candidatus Aenigmatarchaeota archaeon]
MSLENTWKERYQAATDIKDLTADVLTGFNANIDVVHDAGSIELEDNAEPVLKEKLESMDDLVSGLKYCVENGENHEVDFSGFDIELEGKESIGGQAGIISNYLAKNGNGVIFYTPLLSEELADMLEEKILYPVIDGEFVLKNVRDAANTDRTKKNHIFEFESEKTGRMIVSDHLKGFGPYFRKGVEDNLESIDRNIDCGIVSGFHDAEGNIEAKLKKSASQLKKLESPLHLEYVHKNSDLNLLILKYILPHVDSLGLDETEIKKVSKLAGLEDPGEHVNLGEAFTFSKNMVEKFDLSRIHIHTYRYHVTVVKEGYNCHPETIRDAMMFGELSAIQMADTGKIPGGEEIK